MSFEFANREYQKEKVMGASPYALVKMVYARGRVLLQKAIEALEKGEIENAHRSLTKAQDIISELRTALNPAAGDLSRNLEQLYGFMQETLLEANVEKNAEKARIVYELLSGLDEAWRSIGSGGAVEAGTKPVEVQ